MDFRLRRPEVIGVDLKRNASGNEIGVVTYCDLQGTTTIPRTWQTVTYDLGRKCADPAAPIQRTIDLEAKNRSFTDSQKQRISRFAPVFGHEKTRQTVGFPGANTHSTAYLGSNGSAPDETRTRDLRFRKPYQHSLFLLFLTALRYQRDPSASFHSANFIFLPSTFQLIGHISAYKHDRNNERTKTNKETDKQAT
jgi:hypothetical protein